MDGKSLGECTRERRYNIKEEDFISKNLERNYYKDEHFNPIILKIIYMQDDRIQISIPNDGEFKKMYLDYSEPFTYIGYDEEDGYTYEYTIIIDKESED